MRGRNSLGTAGVLRPKKSLICVNEADSRAQAGESHDHEQNAGHQRDHGQAAHAEAKNDAGDDHNESAGRATDLGTGTAQRRDQEASHDGGIQTGLGSYARRDAEGHGQGQGNQAHRDPSQQIMEKRLCRVRP
jgi:hypothetical protein